MSQLQEMSKTSSKSGKPAVTKQQAKAPTPKVDNAKVVEQMKHLQAAIQHLSTLPKNQQFPAKAGMKVVDVQLKKHHPKQPKNPRSKNQSDILGKVMSLGSHPVAQGGVQSASKMLTVRPSSSQNAKIPNVGKMLGASQNTLASLVSSAHEHFKQRFHSGKMDVLKTVREHAMKAFETTAKAHPKVLATAARVITAVAEKSDGPATESGIAYAEALVEPFFSAPVPFPDSNMQKVFLFKAPTKQTVSAVQSSGTDTNYIMRFLVYPTIGVLATSATTFVNGIETASTPYADTNYSALSGNIGHRMVTCGVRVRNTTNDTNRFGYWTCRTILLSQIASTPRGSTFGTMLAAPGSEDGDFTENPGFVCKWYPGNLSVDTAFIAMNAGASSTNTVIEIMCYSNAAQSYSIEVQPCWEIQPLQANMVTTPSSMCLGEMDAAANLISEAMLDGKLTATFDYTKGDALPQFYDCDPNGSLGSTLPRGGSSGGAARHGNVSVGLAKPPSSVTIHPRGLTDEQWSRVSDADRHWLEESSKDTGAGIFQPLIDWGASIYGDPVGAAARMAGEAAMLLGDADPFLAKLQSITPEEVLGIQRAVEARLLPPSMLQVAVAMLAFNLQFSTEGATFDVNGQRAGFLRVSGQKSLFGFEVSKDRLVRWDETMCPVCPPEYDCKAAAHVLPPIPRPIRAVEVSDRVTPQWYEHNKQYVTPTAVTIVRDVAARACSPPTTSLQLNAMGFVDKTNLQTSEAGCAVSNTCTPDEKSALNPCRYCKAVSPDHIGRNCPQRSTVAAQRNTLLTLLNALGLGGVGVSDLESEDDYVDTALSPLAATE